MKSLFFVVLVSAIAFSDVAVPQNLSGRDYFTICCKEPHITELNGFLFNWVLPLSDSLKGVNILVEGKVDFFIPLETYKCDSGEAFIGYEELDSGFIANGYKALIKSVARADIPPISFTATAVYQSGDEVISSESSNEVVIKPNNGQVVSIVKKGSLSKDVTLGLEDGFIVLKSERPIGSIGLFTLDGREHSLDGILKGNMVDVRSLAKGLYVLRVDGISYCFRK